MRVLMLTSSYPSSEADWRGLLVKEIAQVLVEHGMKVAVAAPRPIEVEPASRPSEPDVYWLPKVFPVRPIGFHGYGLEVESRRDLRVLANLVPFLGAFAAEAQFLARLADVIVAHWLFPMGLVGALIGRIAQRPVGIVAHSGPPWPLRVPPLAQVARASLKRANIACVSESVERQVRAMLGADGNTTVLRPGVTLFPSVEPRLSDDRPMRILFVGRLVELKGPDLVLEAASMLGTGYEWTIVGGGPMADGLRFRACKQVKLVGELSPAKVIEEMRRHDALVIPSRVGLFGRSEGFPRVLLEAWACGLPVVASNSGGLAEAITRHGGGILFKTGDARDLARAVAKISDVRERRRLRAQALGAASEYSWARVGGAWVAWAQSLARG